MLAAVGLFAANEITHLALSRHCYSYLWKFPQGQHGVHPAMGPWGFQWVVLLTFLLYP